MLSTASTQNGRFPNARRIGVAAATLAALFGAAGCEGNPAIGPDGDANGLVNCGGLLEGPTVGPGEPGELVFPVAGCSPRDSGRREYFCCSDDPSAPDGLLPEYVNKGIAGATPFFAGVNNDVGTSGMCVRTADIPSGSGLDEANNCPVACNPTWDDNSQAAVCGGDRVCCQTRVMQPEDCVLDGDSWRAATGADIAAGLTQWNPEARSTHQDAGLEVCRNDDGELTECALQLTVADQRGFCLALGPGALCPAEQADYTDTCTKINMGLVDPPR